MNSTTKKTIWLTIIGLIVTLVLVSFLEEKTLANVVTVVGTVGSIIGLIIAYVNIIDLQKVYEQTNKKIDNALLSFVQTNSLTDISRTINYCQEILYNIRLQKLELALLRMEDLRHMLAQFTINRNLNDLTNKEEYIELQKTIGIDWNNIHSYILGDKRKVNFTTISNNIDTLRNYLSVFETELKKVIYDTAKHN